MAPVQALELKDVQISAIQPLKKTDHAAAIEASLLDLSFLDVYIPAIFFYKAKKQSDAGDLIAKMKESLSKVLVPFFPFAGRWVRTYDSRIRELVYTDEGVPFIEAAVDQELDSVVNMGSLELNPQLGSFKLLGLVPTAFNQDVDAPLPALFVQVTKFKCGGVALTVSLNHMIADGVGMMQFLKAWSEFALTDDTSIVPNHDRSLVFPRESFMEFSSAESGNPPPKDTSEPKTSESNGTTAIHDETSRTDPGDAYRLRSIRPVVSKMFYVKRKAMEDPKRKAAEENINVTTVDLISAYLWQFVSNLVASNETPSILSTFVEGRNRFLDLPGNYIGNTVILASTTAVPSNELPSHSLASAASLVHKAVNDVNSTTWKYILLSSYKLPPLPSLPFAHLTISSWLRFPIYEVSFGCGYGNPVFVCWNNCSEFIPLGIAVIFPPPPSYSKDIIASVQLFVSEKDGFAKALHTDEKFLSIFHPSNMAL